MALYNGGSGSNFREYADAPQFDITAALTVAIFAWPNFATSSLPLTAVGRGPYTGQSEWALGCNVGTGQTNIRWSIRTTANSQKNVVSSSSFVQNAWTHLVGVFDSTGNAGGPIIRLYMNGGLEGSTTFTGGPGAIAQAIRVGARTGASSIWDGPLANLGIWSAALTQEEITALSLGVDPALIRPSARIIIDPLQLNSRDIIGGLGTDTGTLVASPQPRIFGYPAYEVPKHVPSAPVFAKSGWFLNM